MSNTSENNKLKDTSMIKNDVSVMKNLKDVSPNDSREIIKNQDNEDHNKSVANTSRNTQRSKRKNYIIEDQKSAIEHLAKKIDKKYALQQFFEAKRFNQFMIILTAFYSVLMFCQFSLDDPTEEENSTVDIVLNVFQYVELGIIIIFIIEITLKCYCFGLKVYFKQKMYIVDAVVILLSLLLLVLNYLFTEKTFQLVSKFLRTMFRFLRLFMILRKVKDINKKTLELEGLGDKTPVEKILGIIDNLKSVITEDSYLKELEWASLMISSNKLYEPIVDKSQKENQNYKILKQLMQWMEQYAGKKKDDQKDDKAKKDDQKEKQQNVKKEEKVQVIAQVIPETIEEEFIYNKIQTTDKQTAYFSNLESREFMVFEFFKEGFGNEVPILMNYLFEYYDCYTKWKIEPELLIHNLNKLRYIDNPYHNKIHAFDVTQTMFFFMKRCKFAQLGKLNKIDIGTSFIACAIHDVDHPGFNNPYQMNAKTPLTILYNDKSPLENHHLSVTFKLLRDNKSLNIFQGLDKKTILSIRDTMIQMILKTDMTQHFTSLAQLKGRLATNEFDCSSADKTLSLITLLHAADVSNPFKPFHIYQEWTHRVLNEFWIQGDKEREQNLPISYLCDRYTTNLAKSQMGFIDFIVKPFFETICQFLPDLSSYMSIFESNKQEWQIYEEYYERQLVLLQAQKKALEEQKSAIAANASGVEDENKRKLVQQNTNQNSKIHKQQSQQV